MGDNTDLLTDLYIGGKAVPAGDGGRFAVQDPATGEVITTVADGTVEDAMAAVDAADRAAESWAAMAPRERAEILRTAFELNRASRGSRPADLAGERQGASGRPGRGRLRGGVLPLVLGGGRTGRRRGHHGALGRQPDRGPPPAGRHLRARDATEFGLVAYVYTGDLARGLRVSEKFESGMVGLNRGLVSDPAAPFGGVKQSGIGREGGHEGMLDYLETQYVAVQW
jgi:acyl-CoA reductase-like NAD-dependent aldehyde dehydrogenase